MLNLITRIEQFISANPFALYDKRSIAFVMECHPKNAQKQLDTIHEGGQLLVIDNWIRGNGPPSPVYRSAIARPGVDAPRPDPLPPTTKRAARRARPEVREQEARVKRNERAGLPKHQLPTPRLGIWNL